LGVADGGQAPNFAPTKTEIEQLRDSWHGWEEREIWSIEQISYCRFNEHCSAPLALRYWRYVLM